MEKETVNLIYRCYLGKTMQQRLAAISRAVRKHNGADFFKEYSTDNDSIVAFLSKCNKMELKLW